MDTKLKCAALLLVGLLLGYASTGFAQNITVQGTVTDAQTGKPMVGVNILVVGTSTGTVTDINGHYKLAVPSLQDSLRFSFIGYKQQTVPINGRTTINIQLEPSVISGQQLIVTGYQKQQKAKITGAIATVNTQTLDNSSGSNLITALQGHIPGVFIQASGEPGGQATVRIRGVSTLNNNSPLYIVDGIPTESYVAQNLSPNVIKSIQILKGAAAASIYGSRASNGVILITTKKGNTNGKLHITFSSKLTTQKWIQK